MADRHQIRDARRRLLLEEADRIGPAGWGAHTPCAERGTTRRASRPGLEGGVWVHG